MEYEELRFIVCEPKAGSDGDPRMLAHIEASSTGPDFPTERARRLAQVDFPGAAISVVDEFEDEGQRVVWLSVWESDPAEATYSNPLDAFEAVTA